MMRPDPAEIAIARCVFAFSTIVIALTLSYVAHYEIGLSEQDIRDIALTGAIFMGLILAIEYFGEKLRKPKWCE
jgi:hypothetical protein